MGNVMRPLVLVLALLPAALPAAELKIGANDSVATVLAAHSGKKVTVRLRAGQDLTGVVRTVNGTSVQIGELSGQEFFDAVIRLDAIDAVVVRVRER
ncbi:MAG: hypothetical protein AB7Q97_20190 [Gammaproteobacteria bacterium]